MRNWIKESTFLFFLIGVMATILSCAKEQTAKPKIVNKMEEIAADLSSSMEEAGNPEMMNEMAVLMEEMASSIEETANPEIINEMEEIASSMEGTASPQIMNQMEEMMEEMASSMEETANPEMINEMEGMMKEVASSMKETASPQIINQMEGIMEEMATGLSSSMEKFTNPKIANKVWELKEFKTEEKRINALKQKGIDAKITININYNFSNHEDPKKDTITAFINEEIETNKTMLYEIKLDSKTEEIISIKSNKKKKP